jgi:hypothetical protein
MDFPTPAFIPLTPNKAEIPEFTPSILCQSALTKACSCLRYHCTVTWISTAHIGPPRSLTGKQDGAKEGFEESEQEANGEDGSDGVGKRQPQQQLGVSTAWKF